MAGGRKGRRKIRGDNGVLANNTDKEGVKMGQEKIDEEREWLRG